MECLLSLSIRTLSIRKIALHLINRSTTDISNLHIISSYQLSCHQYLSIVTQATVPIKTCSAPRPSDPTKSWQREKNTLKVAKMHVLHLYRECFLNKPETFYADSKINIRYSKFQHYLSLLFFPGWIEESLPLPLLLLRVLFVHLNHCFSLFNNLFITLKK